MKSLILRKELFAIIAVAIIFGFVFYDLFRSQQKKSAILNSGTTIAPETLSGRAACEVPIPDISQPQNTQTPSFEAKDLTD